MFRKHQALMELRDVISGHVTSGHLQRWQDCRRTLCRYM